MIGGYLVDLERQLSAFPLAVSVEVRTEQIDLDRGYIRGVVTFTDGSELHLFEYVVIEDGEPVRETYRYHYQTESGVLVQRWDNAPHHPELPTFPHHVHVGTEVQPTGPVDADDVLAVLTERLRSK